MASSNLNIVLRLRDLFTPALEGTTQEIRQQKREINAATKAIRDFGNKANDSFKKLGKAAAIGVAGLATGFMILGETTAEYREAQGKLNTAFESMGMSSKAAATSYKEFYKILGDTDTATEASQLLSKLALNEQDITKWTKIAAGVSGQFGDSLPIESFIEATNETAKVGKVTGTLADALNWVGISEDEMNAKLENLSTEEERNALLMETLSGAYDDAADSFYKNNAAIVQSRANQVAMQEVTGKLGEAAVSLKNKFFELAGVSEDGSIRAGSALDLIMQGAEKLKTAIENIDLDKVRERFDKLRAVGEKLLPILTGLVAGFVSFNVISKAVALITTLTTVIRGAAAAGGILNVVMAANPIGLVITAIGLLVAAGVALYQNWDTVKEKFTSVFNAIKEKATTFVSAVKEKLQPFIDLITKIKDGLASLGFGKTGTAEIYTKQNAMGTPYFTGGFTSINERGGEIVSLPSGTQIIPHDVSKKAAGGTTVNVNLNIAGNVIGNRAYMEEVGSYIAKKVLLAQGVV